MNPLLFLVVLFSIAFSDPICTNGFTLVNGNKCLKLFSTPAKHRSAESTCNAFGGALVTIRNAIDNRAVATFITGAGSSVWIGAYCFESYNPTKCYFDDDSGTASTYDNFAKGFPNTDLGGCLYMALSGSLAGQWISSEGEDVEMAFACEIPTTKTDTCMFNYNGFCYFPSNSITMTTLPFNEAEDICRQYCGHLASIHSRREINYIKSLYSTANVSSITIGALAALPQLPYWIDSTRWEFSHVSPLGPTVSRRTPVCVQAANWNILHFDTGAASDCDACSN